jgi:uncharacterized protein YdeI (YjbR/CyaY-like superfamily)
MGGRTTTVAKPPSDEMPIVAPGSAKAWETWLRKQHAGSNGVWLRLVRKAPDVASFTHAEALDAALCYGWIDGQARGETTTTWLCKFTPRRKRSLWSKNNRKKVEALIAEGRMRPAGLAEIERAKQDGRWDAAYDSWSEATPPPDLVAALDADPRARTAFETLDRRNRYAILFRTHTAKKPETRARRIAQFVTMLAKGEKIYP